MGIIFSTPFPYIWIIDYKGNKLNILNTVIDLHCTYWKTVYVNYSTILRKSVLFIKNDILNYLEFQPFLYLENKWSALNIFMQKKLSQNEKKVFLKGQQFVFETIDIQWLEKIGIQFTFQSDLCL